MPRIASVAVFCGARTGYCPAYQEAAAELGSALGGAGIRLVYGGGRIGLMGVLAEAATAAGGEVLGVIPDFLRRA
ncbi:MAG: TIGR00730 family Rossman fold protein, partial [Acidisphaera sp.]|nr:TIGR00730 family Rossman fold protein [Acidisphaera sp.]